MAIPNKKREWLKRFSNIKFGSNITWGFVAGALLLMLFGNLAGDLLDNELLTFDTIIGDYIRGLVTVQLTKWAIIFTYFGSPSVEFGILLMAGGFWFYKLKHFGETVVLAICLTGGWLLNIVLKMSFQRARPDIQHLIAVGGYSFPSGHAMVATVFYGMLGYLIWLNLRERSKTAWIVPVLTALLIFSIGVSRIYLGVHFSSDVLAGFAAGGLWLTGCIVGLHAFRKKNQHN